MSKIVRLTETDLVRLVKKVIEEQSSTALLKIYDDKGETKVLGGVSIKGSPKKVGFDKKKLEIQEILLTLTHKEF